MPYYYMGMPAMHAHVNKGMYLNEDMYKKRNMTIPWPSHFYKTRLALDSTQNPKCEIKKAMPSFMID